MCHSPTFLIPNRISLLYLYSFFTSLFLVGLNQISHNKLLFKDQKKIKIKQKLKNPVLYTLKINPNIAQY